MERHERDVRLRRIVKTFIYFLIIAALLVMFLIVRRWEEKKVNAKPQTGLVRTLEVSELNQPKS